MNTQQQNAIDLLIKEVLDDNLEKSDGFVYDLKNSIETKNKEKFKEAIEKAIKIALNKMLQPTVLSQLKFNNFEIKIAGYHYISLSQGDWIRIIGIDYDDTDGSELPEMLNSYYNDIYERVPRESNIFVSDMLVNPIQIQLGGSKNDIPFLPGDKVKNLRDFLATDIDLLKHIAKIPFYKDAEDKDDETIKDKLFSEDQIIDFLKALYSHFIASISKEKEIEIKKKFIGSLPYEYDRTNQKTFEFYKWILELFVFSFFSTIWAKIDFKRPLFVLVLPYMWGIKSVNSQYEEIVKYATFGCALQNGNNIKLTDQEIKTFSRYIQFLPLYILAQEHSVAWECAEPSHLIVEDTIRQCVTFDLNKQENLKRLNKCKIRLMQWLDIEKSYGKRELSWPKDIKKYLGRVNCSRRYIDLLEKLKKIAEQHNRKREEDPLKPNFIFLYSEPGCGKEAIAPLIHLFSFRTGKKNKLSESLNKRRADNTDLFTKCAPLMEKDKNDLIKKIGEWSKSGTTDLSILNFDTGHLNIRKDPFFNFIVYPCSELDKENYKSVLYGSLDDGLLGLFLKAFLTGGTIFLDEFNRIDSKIADSFLRVLEEPYEIQIPGFPQPIKNLNPLIIFASNKSREELIKDGINDAVIFRISQNYFEIPPLRNRPEDIAIFVNFFFWKHNSEIEDHSEKISSIELPALRLICELHWLENYRGLKGFLQDIIDDWKMRGVTAKIISFDEIIKSLKRRDLLK